MSTAILKIDTTSDTVTTFGSFSGERKWDGGVLANNGAIYAFPLNAETVLKINPSDDSATTFGSLGSGGYKWTGGAAAPNGKIYGGTNVRAAAAIANLSCSFYSTVQQRERPCHRPSNGHCVHVRLSWLVY